MHWLKRKSYFAMIASLILIFGVLAACSKKTDGDPGVISWLSFNPPETNDSPVQKALEELFDVKFENIRVERNDYRGQINMKISTGDVPDVIYLDGPGDVDDLARQGVLTEISIEEIEEFMPEYADSLREMDPNIFEYALVDGKNYGIPLMWPTGDLPFLPGYNGDWLKKIGYDEAPKTLEEFEDVLRKFRNNDPDGNGKKDTYGISGQGANDRSFSAVFAAHGVKANWMVDDDGKIYHGLTTQGAKETLKLLNKWYEEDLIDPEFVTKNPTDAHNDFINQRVGIRDWQSFQFEPRLGIIAPQFYAANPDTEIIIGKPLEGPYAKNVAYAYGARNGYIVFGAQLEDHEEKKEKILEILNALATDEEAYLLSVYGIEGEHYEMKDGVPMMNAEYSSEATKYKIGAGTFYGMFGQKSKLMEKYDHSKETLKYMEERVEGVENIRTFIGVVPAQDKYPDMQKVADEYYINFVTGKLDIDENWDKFISDWEKAGLKEITEEFNDKYSETYKIK
ncbi:extracellular solute-binding protein [Lederbergia graminis]|uniref:Extracellular solute-binding protein n=1 Tax=Lederbergia graminis TaxID=735518 RepID=A0ABW0LFT0_9BACI